MHPLGFPNAPQWDFSSSHSDFWGAGGRPFATLLKFWRPAEVGGAQGRFKHFVLFPVEKAPHLLHHIQTPRARISCVWWTDAGATGFKFCCG